MVFFAVVEMEGTLVMQEVIQFIRGDTSGMVVTMHKSQEMPAFPVQQATDLLVGGIGTDVESDQ